MADRIVFGVTPAPIVYSKGRRECYQDRNKRLLAIGTHPMTMQPLREEGDKCGNCTHLVQRGNVAGHYLKCSRNPHNTGGPATDCRAKWPACVLWEKAET